MRRDPELIRLLMLKLEAWEKPATAIQYIGYKKDLAIAGYTDDEVYYHVDQILQIGWIDSGGPLSITGMTPGGQFSFHGLTPKGHDFVDSVRDDVIWKLTKDGAKEAGGYTLQLLSALGKGFVKKQIEKLTGIPIGEG
ncbi:DUF2513 domain-containing protein [Pseudomonas sp. 1176_21]|uniref:DUF2513 domain-containing protein n=1 Tax=Pseudomonas sp. 1176_21 TaxID=2604453 RepID=UPI00406475A9